MDVITIAVLDRKNVLEYSDKLNKITGVFVRARHKRRRRHHRRGEWSEALLRWCAG